MTTPNGASPQPEAGIRAQFAVFGASSTAYGLHNDRASGVIDRFRSFPAARSAVLTGRTSADVIRSSVILVLQLGVGVLLGFRWQAGISALLAGPWSPTLCVGSCSGSTPFHPGRPVAGQTLLAIAWTTGIVAVFVPLAVRVYGRSVS